MDWLPLFQNTKNIYVTWVNNGISVSPLHRTSTLPAKHSKSDPAKVVQKEECVDFHHFSKWARTLELRALHLIIRWLRHIRDYFVRPARKPVFTYWWWRRTYNFVASQHHSNSGVQTRNATATIASLEIMIHIYKTIMCENDYIYP